MSLFSKFKIFISSFILVGSIAPVGIGSYIVINDIINNGEKNNNELSISNSDTNNASNEWKRFFKTNSFKVALSVQNGNYITTTYGTCWSWFYSFNKNTNLFEWYLMTNFHVVNSFCYDIWNNSANISLGEFGYLDNLIFDVSDIATINNNIKFYYYSNKYNEIKLTDVNDIDIIMDNKINNSHNDSILFSNQATISNNNSLQRYSLDMALIKISFNKDYSNELSQNYIINPFKNWLENKIIFNINKFNEEQSPTYIGGNPHKNKTNIQDNNIVIKTINDNWELKYGKINSKDDNDPSNVALQYLQAPYMYTNKSYKDWNLIGGSSGSPAMQRPMDISEKEFNDISFQNIVTKTIPSGIYWGAEIIRDDLTGVRYTKPSIIPFIFDKNDSKYARYNIFSNFENLYNQNKLN